MSPSCPPSCRMTAPIARAWRAAAAAALWAFAACEHASAPSATVRSEVFERLVAPGRIAAELAPAMLIEREAETGATTGLETARLATATLGGDTRLVLFRYPTGSLAQNLPVSAAVAADLSLDLPVPATLLRAAHLAVQVQAWDGTRWRNLEGMVGPMRSDGGVSTVRLDARMPAGARSPSKQITVVAFEAAEAGRTTFRTQPVDVPAHAVLELAMGILAPARGQGPVRFSVSACEGENCRAVFSQVLDDRDHMTDTWCDASIDLRALGGSRVSFVFDTALVAGDPTRFSLPVWANPTLLVPSATRRRRRNVVLVSIDTLRADHLGTYGYARGTSPFLDRLAAKGTVFERLIAEATTTGPSHMTMFTSVPAPVHGLTSGWLGIAVPAVTVAELLRTAGYLTAAFTEDGQLAHERGFGRGFDVYGENRKPNRNSGGQVALTFGQGRAWLARNRGRPFFLFLHTYQVHSPYVSPPTRRQWSLDEQRQWIRLDRDQLRWREAAESYAINYDRNIRFVDDELAALVAWMRAQGLFQDTILLVLSDHGEQFYEHGELGHGTPPYEEVVHAPLVAYGAGVARGRRVSTAAAHVDVMPTILELAEIRAPSHAQGGSLVAELAAGPVSPPAIPRVLFSTSWALSGGLIPPAEAVLRGSQKLIRMRTAGGIELRTYDLDADPFELSDLSAVRTDETAELVRLLDERDALLTGLRAELAGGAAADVPAPQLDPDHEQKLRSLGYIE